MAKPGRREHKPSNEIDRFVNRSDECAIFHHYISSPTEPPVLVFYGIGGAGKTWLLKKLMQETPRDLGSAVLDFAVSAGGHRFVIDPSIGLYEIRQQLAGPSPRFDLAFAMIRSKQGAADEPAFLGQTAVGVALQLSAAVIQAIHGMAPGVGVVLNKLTPSLLARLKDTPLERFLASATGGQFLLDLRAKTTQEIGDELIECLAADLQDSLPIQLNRAVRMVLFFDTFDAINSGIQNTEHQRSREQWVRDLAATLGSALIVIASQNRLTWGDAEPEWTDHLDQQMVGGLSETDARQFLQGCLIDEGALQNAILATAHDSRGRGFHCFSLGLCADIVFAERRNQFRDPLPEELCFRPQDWEALARRFLKSLNSNVERRWIERLALTPRFDEAGGCAAFSTEPSVAQDAEWQSLHDYSFVQPLAETSSWFAIRSPMRRAIENQPSARARAERDHQWWRQYWSRRSDSRVDEAASLAWYHLHCVNSDVALREWIHLAKMACDAVPPRMQEHYSLLLWWDAVDLLNSVPFSSKAAESCHAFGAEFLRATIGNLTSGLRQAITYFEAALRVFSEHDFPREWASVQNDLGRVWWQLPTGNRTENLRKAMMHYEAALRVRTEQNSPQEWAITQSNLGLVWWEIPVGDRTQNLRNALECHAATLRVRTEQMFPYDWARTQSNLGLVWSNLPTGDRNENLRRAMTCHEAALRVFTERDFPQDWARTQNNLGGGFGGPFPLAIGLRIFLGR